MKTRAIIEGKKRIAKDFLMERNQSLKKIAFLSKSLDLNCYKSYFLNLSSLEEIVSSQKSINFDLFNENFHLFNIYIYWKKKLYIYNQVFIFMKNYIKILMKNILSIQFFI